jgi:hypothetical protein
MQVWLINTEWSKKVIVCKRTVARLPLGCSMQYVSVELHNQDAGKASFKIILLGNSI